MPLNNTRLTRIQSKFYFGYVITILLVFSPLKALAYVSPFIFLLFFVFTRPLVLDKNIIKRSAVLIAFWLLLYLFYSEYFSSSFFPISFCLAIATYSSIYPALILSNNKFNNEYLVEKIYTFSKYFFFVQGIIGIIQVSYGFLLYGSFDTATGDHAEGTIHLPLHAELAFSNPMYSSNMIFLMIFLAMYQIKNKIVSQYWLLIPGIFAIVLASVMHQIAFFLTALMVALFFLPKTGKIGEFSVEKIKRTSIKIILMVIAIGVVFLRSNFSQLISIPKQAITEEGIPKAIVTKHALLDLPKDEPMALFFGLGPGQFSSRAALIASGYYLGRPTKPKTIPFLPLGYNKYSKKYVIDVLLAFSHVTWFGSTQKPFYSFLTILTEFGLIGIFIFTLSLWSIVMRIKLAIKTRASATTITFGFGTIVILLFIVFLGVQLNYYEVVQSIFLGILLGKLMFIQVVLTNQNKK